MIKPKQLLSFRLFLKVLKTALITFLLLLTVIEKALEILALF
jgi:hypothetical protein